MPVLVEDERGNKINERNQAQKISLSLARGLCSQS